MKINSFFYLVFSKIKLIHMFLNLFLSLYISRNIYIQLSEINLIIQGKGNQSILYKNFYLNPSEVIVNGEIKSYCKKSCDFDKDLNDVV